MQAKLSINVNKIALLRNSRGTNFPNLVQWVKDCEKWGADGITVHPRPDERHVTQKDVFDLKPMVTTEFNIEGYPSQRFVDLVIANQPTQVTLVPDKPGQLTSNAGWNTVEFENLLTDVISAFKEKGIRTSLFMEPNAAFIEGAAKVGADRIEYYTGPYAQQYRNDKYEAIKGIVETASIANQLGLGINAGHDLNLENLSFFAQSVPNLLEVSIGHAFTVDCLYFGIQNTIGLYKRCLQA